MAHFFNRIVKILQPTASIDTGLQQSTLITDRATPQAVHGRALDPRPKSLANRQSPREMMEEPIPNRYRMTIAAERPFGGLPLSAATAHPLSLSQPSSCDLEQSLQRLDLSLDDVMTSSALSSIRNVDAGWVSFQEGHIKAQHEPKYKLIRFNVGHEKEVVNIHLSDDASRVRSISGWPEITRKLLQTLMSAGLLCPGLLRAAGNLDAKTNLAMETAAHDHRSSARLRTHDVCSLTSIEHYPGADHNTVFAAMGEAHLVSSARADIAGIYTTGASPCAIFIVVVKNAQGNAECVAMAHVDSFVRDGALDLFLQSLPMPGKVEVTLLAGNLKTAQRVLKAADKAGATVTFAHAGHQPTDGYAAAVDRDGKVYFGRRPALLNLLDSSVISSRVRGRIDKFRLHGSELPIHEQLPVQLHS